MSDQPAIQVTGLRKTFHIGFWRKKVDAVHDASFEIRQGEVFGLVGPNGAGKTTTMKMLLGLIRPDGGQARVFGQPIGPAASRNRVGFLAGPPHFPDQLRPSELLHYFGQLRGMPAKRIAERSDELLKLVGLDDARNKAIRKFSKGMIQRIGLAQALMHDPDLLILDEPMGGLDPLGRKDVRDIILSLKARGKTVLFSSHILTDVEEVCDRVAIIVRGQVTKVGSVREIAGDAQAGAEIRFIADGVDSSTLPDGVRRQAGGEWLMTVHEAAAVDNQLRALLDLGASIIGVDRHRRNLENVFVEAARVPVDSL